MCILTLKNDQDGAMLAWFLGSIPRPFYVYCIILSRDSEQADTADHVYYGLVRVRLILSQKSASLSLEYENAITEKITPQTEAARF